LPFCTSFLRRINTNKANDKTAFQLGVGSLSVDKYEFIKQYSLIARGI